MGKTMKPTIIFKANELVEPSREALLDYIEGLEEELARREAEYNKLTIFFEQFGDLSGCYDAEDVVKVGRAKLAIREAQVECYEVFLEITGEALANPEWLRNLAKKCLAKGKAMMDDH